MRGRWELSDAQWELIEPILRPKRRSDGRGRPWQDTRAVLNGILWVLGTGAQWRELPKKYPPYQTCHRRFQQWVGKAGWSASCVLWRRNCRPAGNWNWRRPLSTPPSRGQERGPRGRAHETRQRDALANDHSLPLAVSIESASPHENQLKPACRRAPRAELPRHPPGTIDG